jgi:hypothetical protein
VRENRLIKQASNFLHLKASSVLRNAYQHFINCQAQSLGYVLHDKASLARATAYLRSLDFVLTTVTV